LFGRNSQAGLGHIARVRPESIAAPDTKEHPSHPPDCNRQRFLGMLGVPAIPSTTGTPIFSVPLQTCTPSVGATPQVHYCNYENCVFAYLIDYPVGEAIGAAAAGP
jgi:hypothetical protein